MTRIVKKYIFNIMVDVLREIIVVFLILDDC